MTAFGRGLACLAYALAVAYLSFIPLGFRWIEPEQAWSIFRNAPYLQLGVASRADWVTNILMYVPLGFLAARLFGGARPGRWRVVAALAGFATGVLWAFAVEFAQIYFPGRTVSRNDLIAETIGSALGVAVWLAAGAGLADWWRRMLHGGRATVQAALAGYAAIYLAMSLFPFDFLTSVDEIAAKFSAPGRLGWWMAAEKCHRVSCSVWVLVEAAVVVPIGWWWAARRGARHASVPAALAAGLVLGVLIETVQLLIASSSTQGASVIARGAGMMAGALAYRHRGQFGFEALRRWRWLLIAVGILPWMAAVTFINGWITGRWLSWEQGISKLEQQRWLPFFYHYYSPEQTAMLSLLIHMTLYVPVGIAAWLLAGRGGASTGLAWAAAAAAALAAAIAGFGKLFLAGRHPDPTDILLGAAAAWLTVRVLGWMESIPAATASAVRAVPPAVGAVPAEARAGAGRAAEPRSAPAARAGGGTAGAGWALSRPIGAAALLVALAGAVLYPVAAPILFLLLAVYAAVLWRWPGAWVAVLPASVPLLDLAPWSGRLFWDEIDLMVLTTLGVRLLVARPGAGRMPDPGRVRLLALLLLVAAALAATVALWPPPPLDANAFASYLSPYNALRLLLAYLWVAALAILLVRDQAAGRRPIGWLALGMGTGLALTALSLAFERALFVGILDFQAPYRVAGMFSSMHVGGAYLDAYLAMALPFAAWQLFASHRAAVRVVWLLVLLAGAYAVVVTYSRAAVAAAVAALLVFGLGLLWARAGQRARRKGYGLAAVLAAVAFLLLGLQGEFFRARMATLEQDVGVRAAHWQRVIETMPSDPLHLVLGAGLGSFPRLWFWSHVSSDALPSYGFGRDPETGQALLRLAGGRGQYLDQRIRIGAPGDYVLSLTARATGQGARLGVGLCEKAILSSARCVGTTVAPGAQWTSHETVLRVPALGGTLPPGRPVVLTLFASQPSAVIEVDRISLRDPAGHDLVANHDFESGAARWFMTADNHLAWHAHSLPLHVLFEQGLLGLLAMAAIALRLLLFTLVRNRPTPATMAALAALAGFAVIGLIDSLLDAPRTILVVFTVAFAAIVGAQTRPG